MAKSKLERELETSIREELSQKYVTKLNKDRFISDIKCGLGAEIKKNPRGVKIIKSSVFEKITTFLRNLFTKF